MRWPEYQLLGIEETDGRPVYWLRSFMGPDHLVTQTHNDPEPTEWTVETYRFAFVNNEDLVTGPRLSFGGSRRTCFHPTGKLQPAPFIRWQRRPRLWFTRA